MAWLLLLSACIAGPCFLPTHCLLPGPLNVANWAFFPAIQLRCLDCRVGEEGLSEKVCELGPRQMGSQVMGEMEEHGGSVKGQVDQDDDGKLEMGETIHQEGGFTGVTQATIVSRQLP